MKKIKQVILVRHDLKIPKGKLAVQVAHASTMATYDYAVRIHAEGIRGLLEDWISTGMTKTVLKVKNLKQLRYYEKKANDNNFFINIVKDEGNTFFKKPTVTVLGIGPADSEEIDKIVA